MKSFELAVNIERVIRSLKNTWTIIKPACGALQPLEGAAERGEGGERKPGKEEVGGSVTEKEGERVQAKRRRVGSRHR